MQPATVGSPCHRITALSLARTGYPPARPPAPPSRLLGTARGDPGGDGPDASAAAQVQRGESRGPALRAHRRVSRARSGWDEKDRNDY